MNNKLPDFPRIPRFITEEFQPLWILDFAKVLLIVFISMLLLLQIIREGMALPQNAAKAEAVQASRQKIAEEIAHWKRVANQYTGYRDIYYRIAFLEYKQGNLPEAKKYVQKALEVDPNFDAGKVLGEKIKF